MNLGEWLVVLSERMLHLVCFEPRSGSKPQNSTEAAPAIQFDLTFFLG